MKVNNQKVKYFLSLLVVLNYFVTNAQNDTIWLSDNGSLSFKKEAKYFRFIKKNKDNYSISDYYLNGNKKLQQNFKINNDKTFTGEFNLYYPDGNLLLQQNIVNNIIEGACKSYLKDGTKNESIFKNNNIFDGKFLIETETVVYETIAKDGVVLLKKSYNKGNLNSGDMIEYINGKVKRTAYNNNKIAAESFLNNFGLVENGVDYEFYPFESSYKLYVLRFVKNSKEYKNQVFYENGSLQCEGNISLINKTENFYNNKGIKIGTLITGIGKNSSLNGTKVDFDSNGEVIEISKYIDWINTESTEFVNGLKTKLVRRDKSNKEIYNENYDSKGKIISKLFYDLKSKLPANGTQILPYKITEYKNKVIISQKEHYKSGKLFSEIIKDERIFYDEKGKEIGRLSHYNLDQVGENVEFYHNYEYYLNRKKFILNEGKCTGYEVYKNKSKIEKIVYFEKSDIENSIYRHSFYLPEIENTYIQRPIKIIEYYDTGQKRQEEIANDDGDILLTTVFDINGKVMGKYDNLSFTGEVFYDNGSIKKYKNGDLIYEKDYHGTYNINGFVDELDFFTETNFN